MEDRIIERGYIEIRDGLIERLGPMMEFIETHDSELLDAGGMIAFPGFIDAHTHLGMWEDSLNFEGDDGNEDTDPSTPQIRAIDAVNAMDRGFIEALEVGITTVATGPGSANPIGGQVLVMKTFGHRVDDMVVREPCAIKFAFGENPKNVYHGKNQMPATRMATAALIRESLLKTRDYIAAKEKAKEDDERVDFDFKCASLVPLLNGEIDAHMHAHRADDIFTAVRIAKEFSFSPTIIHCTEGHLIKDELSGLDIKAICGPVLCGRSKPELKELSFKTPGELAKAGMIVAITTDHPASPINLLPFCAAMAVKAGMDKIDAIKAITINAAKILGLNDKIGSLKEGKEADIVIYDSDPLEKIGANAAYVISSGKIVAGDRA